MGRLPSLIAAVALAGAAFAGLALAGCDDDKKPVAPPPTGPRSDSVKAAGTGTAAAMPTVGAMAAHAAPPAAAGPRALCEGQLDKPGHAMPKQALSHAGVPALGDAINVGQGRWTWINFWAAWCGPCKEEMPRLVAWSNKLAQSGTPMTLAFVSIDDDERQLRAFLDQQPVSGVRATYWLPDGAARDGWLQAMRLKNPPELPAHALVDPQGQVRCLIQGAVEEADFKAVQAIASRR